MTTYVDAILSLRPGAQWTLHDENDYDSLIWNDTEHSIPTKQELDDEVERLKVDFINKEYQRQREYQYPNIKSQLDMIWHMMDDEIIPGKGSEWYNSIQAVKAKYPKP